MLPALLLSLEVIRIALKVTLLLSIACKATFLASRVWSLRVKNDGKRKYHSSRGS